MWPVRDHAHDGAYVWLQFARHLAQGRGLVFNAGERVYGVASPLWVALIGDGDDAQARTARGRARASARSRRSARWCCSSSSCGARCARRSCARWRRWRGRDRRRWRSGRARASRRRSPWRSCSPASSPSPRARSGASVRCARVRCGRSRRSRDRAPCCCSCCYGTLLLVDAQNRAGAAPARVRRRAGAHHLRIVARVRAPLLRHVLAAIDVAPRPPRRRLAYHAREPARAGTSRRH